MDAYTNEQRLFIALKFNELKSPKLVRIAFMKKFGTRISPSRKTVYRINGNLHDKFTVRDLRTERKVREKSVCNEENMAKVCDLFTNQSNTSLRRAALQLR